MVTRQYWLGRLRDAWRRRSVVWLMGARRSGKTVLSQSVAEAEYFDCELPSVRRMLRDSEAFFGERRGGAVILDEIHRLDDPSEVLKIAADHFPGTKVLATGSSSLGASARFRDTLAGRKAEVLLTPMNHADLAAFGRFDLKHRLRNGGLPSFFLEHGFPERDFEEWIDSYWARDIQELFRLERRHSFQKLLELLMVQSGGIFEASSLAAPCEASRPTVQNYLVALEATFVVTVVRPWHTSRAAEIVAAPKVYGFDTGFVGALRDWQRLRPDDLGSLWEHYVLNEIRSLRPRLSPQHWRDKQKHEVEFVLRGAAGSPPVTLEAKWSAEAFDPSNLRVFRRHYPDGANYVVAQDVRRRYTRNYGDLQVHFAGIEALAGLL